MFNNKFLYLLLFIFLIPRGFTQQNPQWVSIKEAKFEFKSYTWGDEFSFVVRGEAHRLLNNARLIFEVKHQGKLASQYNFSIKTPQNKQEFFPFVFRSEPLNEPYQRILAGKYNVHIFLIIAGQSQQVRKQLNSLQKAKLSLFSKDIFWGTREEFLKQDQEIKNFYYKRVENLNALYQALLKNAGNALNTKTSIQYGRPNPFVDAEKKAFSANLWRLWLENKLQIPVKKELSLLRKFHKKTYCRRYPTPKSHLEEFVFILLRYSRMLSIRIYEHHKIKVDIRDASRVDPFGVEKGIVDYLAKLLNDTTKSLSKK